MSRKHPWMTMRHGLQDYRRRLAAGQPSGGEHNERGVDAERGEPPGVGGRDRDVGEHDRPDDRDQERESDRDDRD